MLILKCRNGEACKGMQMSYCTVLVQYPQFLKCSELYTIYFFCCVGVQQAGESIRNCLHNDLIIVITQHLFPSLIQPPLLCSTFPYTLISL